MRRALADAGLPHRVEPTADLAVLQFAKYRLWKDLDEHWAELTANPLVHHLVHRPTEVFADPAPDTAAAIDLDELAARCPVPADASQLRAVAEATAGRTFVLEGPPGTGKSQTITNLLTRAVAEGKRVLFVAEKRAALDVVARRLTAVGMGPFALDLHDKGAKAAGVRAQVAAALEHAVAVDAEDVDAAGEDLRAARRTLARYAHRLHAQNSAGLSYYTARTAVLAMRDGVPTLPVSPAFVAAASPETLAAVRRALALLPDIADLVRPSPRHVWAFVDTAQVDLPAAQQTAAAVDRAVRDLPSEPHLAGVLREVRTPADLDALAHLLSGPATTLDVLDEVPTERWNVATTTVLGEVAAFSSAVHPGLELATPAALELPLAELYVAAQTAQAGRFMARRAGLRAVRDRLAPVLRPGVKVALGDVPELTARLWRLQTAASGIVARASVIPGLVVPPTWNRPGRAAHLEPAGQARAAGRPGRVAGPGRRRHRQRQRVRRRAAPLGGAGRGPRPRRRCRRCLAARRGRRAAAGVPEQPAAAGRVGGGRRPGAALADDPARARRRAHRADVAAPVGRPGGHPRAPARRRAARGAGAAGHRRAARRGRRPRLRAGPGAGLGHRAPRRLRPRRLRRRGARAGDHPVHRRLTGGARAAAVDAA
ncbi:MAG: AAA family ATPase, partial [Actinomycetota bacterium]|nr:AAA family ATPase [Actinomycetota bacterium]